MALDHCGKPKYTVVFIFFLLPASNSSFCGVRASFLQQYVLAPKRKDKSLKLVGKHKDEKKQKDYVM